MRMHRQSAAVRHTMLCAAGVQACRTAYRYPLHLLAVCWSGLRSNAPGNLITPPAQRQNRQRGDDETHLISSHGRGFAWTEAYMLPVCVSRSTSCSRCCTCPSRMSAWAASCASATRCGSACTPQPRSVGPQHATPTISMKVFIEKAIIIVGLMESRFNQSVSPIFIAATLITP